jgi:hypothetical protein
MSYSNLRLILCWLCLALCSQALVAQTAVVTRNVYLRQDPSTQNEPITKLLPGQRIQLVESVAVSGYYHIRTNDNRSGYVWSTNVRLEQAVETPTPTSISAAMPAPLLASGHAVDWWFVFKFNSAAFPGCSSTAIRTCLFGGVVQNYRAFSQQYVVASSEADSLQQGGSCLGDTLADPVGATFDKIYNGTLNYVIWNDQFYGDPAITGCSTSCSAPWGHSKGIIAWNNDGDGLVMQVTTPSWPASGSNQHPRSSDGNTLGCVTDNDVQVSQHFFSLKLNKSDLLKVLAALQNASVVTDPKNPQIVRNGGPSDVQAAVRQFGVKSTSTSFTNDVLSSGVQLISKPSKLNVPPWQLVSAILGGISLRTATWWANPKIESTTTSTSIACWDNSLPAPGAVEIATSGQWNQTTFGLTGGPGKNFNHAKVGVSTSGTKPLVIFGDMNQQGTLSGTNCASSQNGRGGLFFVVEDQALATSVSGLLQGASAPNN